MKRFSMKKCKWLPFLLPSLLGVSIFVLIPFADVMRRSFFTVMSGQFVGFDNFMIVFQNQAFILAVKNTLRFVAVCLPVLILLSLAVAMILSKRKQIIFFKSVFLMPLAIPAATVVLVWKMIFYDNGMMNALFERLGLTTISFMDTGAAFYVLVISYVWKNLGYTVILWLAGILSISESILQAAKVDGAGEWKTFWYVIMPNLKGTLYTIIVISFLNSFKVFREAYLVAGSYPQESMYLLQHLFNNWFMKLELDKMAAAAVCIAIVLFIAIWLLQNLWDREE